MKGKSQHQNLLIILLIIGLVGFYQTIRTSSVNPFANSLLLSSFRQVYEEKIRDFSKPKTMEIPSLGIEATVEEVGVDQKGRMDVPKDAFNVAWYGMGFIPGEKGNAVIAGHLDSKNGPGVFANLRNLKINDEVIIKDFKNNTKKFVVVDIKTYEAKNFPLNRVFGASDISELILITCAGTFSRPEQEYSQRTVVFTRLAD